MPSSRPHLMTLYTKNLTLFTMLNTMKNIYKESDENNDVEHLQAHAANAEEGLFLLEFDT